MVHKSSLLDQNPGATASADALMGVVPPAFCDHVIYSVSLLSLGEQHSNVKSLP
jgi:hypothetical protein